MKLAEVVLEVAVAAVDAVGVLVARWVLLRRERYAQRSRRPAASPERGVALFEIRRE